LVSDTFAIQLAHWQPLAAVAVPAVAVGLAFSLVALLIESDVGSALFGVLTFPVQFVMFVLVGGGTVVYLDNTDRSVAATSADALDAAQAKLGVLLGAAVRSAVIVFLFCITLIGIPLGVYRLVRWAFVSQSIMLDGEQGKAVLAHSAGLVEGVWWLTLARLIVGFLVIGLPAGIVAQGALVALPGVVGTVIAALTGFITIPFGVIFSTLLFFDRKERTRTNDGTNTDR
jgi:hypothetical protein